MTFSIDLNTYHGKVIQKCAQKLAAQKWKQLKKYTQAYKQKVNSSVGIKAVIIGDSTQHSPFSLLQGNVGKTSLFIALSTGEPPGWDHWLCNSLRGVHSDYL